MPEGLLRYLLYADTVAVNLALALVVGGLASDSWLSPNSSGWGRDMRTKACTARRGGLVLGFIGLLAMLLLQAQAMTDGTDATIGNATQSLLTSTHYGRAWTVGLVGWSMAAAIAWRTARDSARSGSMLLTAAGLTAFGWSRSVVSHAGSQGDFSAYVAIDWLHLALVSLWVGMVLVAATVRLSSIYSSSADGLAAARWTRSLSSTATVALVGIFLTGAFKTWTSVPSLATLWPSDYGVLLATKVALVAVAAGLGGFNRFFVLPPLLRDLESTGSHAVGHSRDHLTRALRLEAIFLVLVLLAAAVLSSTEPPDVG